MSDDQMLKAELREVVRRTILKRIVEHGGNRTRCARSLGISTRTVRDRLKEYAAAGYSVPPPPIGGNFRK